MKIVLVTDSIKLDEGGKREAVLQLLKILLNNKKIHCKLITNKSENKFFLRNNINIIKSFDIIHIFGCWNFFQLYTFIFSKLFKKKIIFCPMGMLEPWALSQKKLKKKFAWFLYQKYILKYSDRVHATSLQEFYNLRKLNITNQEKIIYLPHGIERKQIKINTKVVKKTKIKFLYIGRYHEKKGLEMLINCIAEIKNANFIFNLYGFKNDFMSKIYKLAKKKK